MAITDASAVQFSNTKIRPAADMLGRAYYICKELQNLWNGENWSALITNTSDVINDGAPADGNAPITGIQATNIIVQAEAIVGLFEANSNAVLNDVLQVAINPTP